jgi:hypothetical protein
MGAVGDERHFLQHPRSEGAATISESCSTSLVALEIGAVDRQDLLTNDARQDILTPWKV